MLRLLLALLLILAPTQGWCVTQWTKSSLPATGDNLTAWPTAVNAQWSIVDTLFSNYRRGYNLTYSSGSTIVAGAGEITVSNAGGTIRLFLQNAGSSNITFSNIDTGAEASGTTYYVYCGTSTATDASCTFYISLSSSAPTGVTYYARLGSFVNDGSSNITLITNDNQYVGGFSSASAKSAGVVYQALTDGILTSECIATSTGGMVETIYSDSSSSPSTVIRQIEFGNASGTNIMPLNEPIIKGNYYEVTFTNCSGNNSIKFYPIGQ